MEYTRVQTKSSCTVGIEFINDFEETETRFGRIHRFFRFEHKGQIHRVAYVSVFYSNEKTKNGTMRINQNREYKSKGKIIDVEAIDRKVIFYGTLSDTRILEVPFHESH